MGTTPKNNYNPEQLEAIHTRDTNLLISASAGSGKTAVLIERIFQHLSSGFADIDQLLVVTFTEAAANEMKERMETRLKTAVNQSHNFQEKQRYLEQINKLANAHIQTLHSFCLQIIQEYFYLIDFDPDFILLTDSTQSQLIKEKVWSDMIEQIKAGKYQNKLTYQDYLHLLKTFAEARSDLQLFDMIQDLYQYQVTHPDPPAWLQMAKTHHSTHEFLKSNIFQASIAKKIKENSQFSQESLQKAIRLLSRASTETIDKYLNILENELAWVQSIQNLIADEDYSKLFQQISQYKYAKWPSNSKKSEDYQWVVDVKSYRDNSKDFMNKLINLYKYDFQTISWVEDQIQPIKIKLLNLSEIFAQELTAYKFKHKYVDYNDLEQLTLRILRGKDPDKRGSSAAIYYQHKFKEIMIDEYQDINDVQGTILSYLSHERNQEIGNLFMVGDVKQSIYGFRNAEPALFLNRYYQYQTHDQGQVIILDKNYRSRDEVLQFTNFIFERIMDQEFGEMDYGEKEALTTGNHSFLPASPSSKYNIEVLLYDKAVSTEESEPETDIIQINTSLEGQAHIVGQTIRQLIDQGTTIYDKNIKEERKIRYSDIVILSATKNPFHLFQPIFDSYQIPVYSQKIDNYFQRHEIQLMLALLKIIDNPFQDIPLVAVLRSYFVGLSDEELSWIRIASPQANFYEAVLYYADNVSQTFQNDLVNKLNQFLKQLRSWTDIAQRYSLVELIWTIYLETDYLNYVAGLSNGSQRQANLHALYQRAQDFEQFDFKGVFAFIRYIEKIMTYDNDLAEPVLLNQDQNFVRMMTVHASKGLEFPIVFLINIEKKFNQQDLNKTIICNKDYGIALDHYSFEDNLHYYSLEKTAFKILESNRLKAEEMRKLYVALTRCEQKLYLVATIESQDKWQAELDELKFQQPSNQVLAPLFWRQEGKSWLDWLKLALSVSTEMSVTSTGFKSEQIEIKYYSPRDIFDHLPQSLSFENQFNDSQWLQNNLQKLSDFGTNQRLTDLLNYKYPFLLSTQTSSYQSVSELKRLYEEPHIMKSDYFQDRREESPQSTIDKSKQVGIRYTESELKQPKFIQSSTKALEGKNLGTVIHYILQHLDFKEFQTLNPSEYYQEIERQIRSLAENDMIETELTQNIQTDPIHKFLVSDLGQLIISHEDQFQRERAFSYLVPAQIILQDAPFKMESVELEGEQILIHGIVDGFLEFKDYLILLDYKTNRFRPYSQRSKQEQIQKLMQQYSFQLNLYRQALEIAKGKPVRETYLVLLDFQANIKMHI